MGEGDDGDEEVAVDIDQADTPESRIGQSAAKATLTHTTEGRSCEFLESLDNLNILKLPVCCLRISISLHSAFFGH